MKRLIGERISPGENRIRAVARLCGRVTAADLKAPLNLPPFDNSALTATLCATRI
jgi:molybdopterin biosynthesis enzyme